MKKALCMIAVLTLLLTTACGNPKLKNGEEVVAKINGKQYTANDLYEELKGQYGYNVLINLIDKEIANKEVETTDELKAEIDQYINLYIQYAESYGMSLADFASSYMGISGITDEDSLKEYLLTQSKLSLAIEKAVADKLTDKEIEDYYNDNYKTVYTYRYILLAEGDDVDDAKKAIKDKLKDKKGDDLIDEFAELAKKYSSGENASNGGLVEKAIKLDVNEAVWNKIKDLGNKEYSKDAIKTDEGEYYVLRISKDEAQKLDKIKNEVKSSLAKNKLTSNQTLSYDTLTELRNKYKIAFFDEDLKKGYNSYLDELEDYKKQLAEAAKNSDDKEE